MVVRLLITLYLLAPISVFADPQSKSFSNWRVNQEEVEATYRIASREVTALPDYAFEPDLAKLLTTHLRETIKVRADKEQCLLSAANQGTAEQGYLSITLKWNCPGTASVITLENRAMLQTSPSHIHFARVRISGQGLQEVLFSRRDTSQDFDLNASGAATLATGIGVFTTYLVLGFEHILIGLDHIAFLLALLILVHRLRDLILLITGFTLGHSLTLSLTVLGVAAPDIGMVEALIGFTIAFVTVENISCRNGSSHGAAVTVAVAVIFTMLMLLLVRQTGPGLTLVGLAIFSYCYLKLSNSEQRARQLRPTITILFGLIHGFGFASVLLEVGLPTDHIVAALAGFNIGVEIGQIIIVLTLLLLGRVLQLMLTERAGTATNLLNASLCSLGSFWFVQRLFF